MNRHQLQQRKRRIRSKIHGTAKRPRVSVYRSARTVSVQLIDDDASATLASASSAAAKAGSKTEAATAAGTALAEAAKAKGVSHVVFDRGGYLYHGRVKAVAEALREAGLLT